MAATTFVEEDVILERSVAIPMRDGVLLYADVWRPAADQTMPVLVSRTPYGRDMLQMGLLGAPPSDLVRAGYAVVYQDSRGRFESEGEWAPIGVEVDDGYDTVEWAAAQPWSNGRVGMFGASYMGYTQWLAAIARPPHLVAIAPEVASAEYWGTWFGTGGALRLAHRVAWAAAVGASHARRIGAPEPELEELLDVQARIVAVLAGGEVLAERNRRMAEMVEPLFRYRPLRENPLLAKIAPWMAGSLARERRDDPYFVELDHRSHYRKLDLPAFHVGGWYDINVNGTIANFVGMRAHAATDEARRAQRLIIGPWPHWTPQISVVGDIDFGPNAVLDLEPLRREWFGHWLQDRPAPMLDAAPIRIFVMGENIWRDEWEWPLARTEWSSWYLHSGGNANTSDGDGLLDQQPPSEESVDTFVYDPRDPVPTRGGRLLGVGGAVAGAFDQRDVETRDDVLVYTSEPLSRPTEITGPVTVELWASTSAPDTDFTAKLVEVHADGRAINLCDGIVRARAFAPTPLAPGAAYRFTIELWEISALVAAGNRLRLEISSSNYPHFEPNSNCGKPVGTDTDADIQPASQTVFHDTIHASRLILPVIPAPDPITE
ncbi:MAG: CocE/NonD family hydrolase [Acidimicrobiia bacterium]